MAGAIASSPQILGQSRDGANLRKTRFRRGKVAERTRAGAATRPELPSMAQRSVWAKKTGRAHLDDYRYGSHCENMTELRDKSERAWWQVSGSASNVFAISKERRGRQLRAAPDDGNNPAPPRKLFLARIVSRIDVVNASWADELNLENRFFVAGPSIMRVFCRIHPQCARL
jgi:hypothetical protein